MAIVLEIAIVVLVLPIVIVGLTEPVLILVLNVELLQRVIKPPQPFKIAWEVVLTM